MNNLRASLKKFFGNKNVVTILGVLLCLVILYIGYNWRVNSQVRQVEVPYAKVLIQPRTEITKKMIGKMSVPKSFLEAAAKSTEDEEGFYSTIDDIVGKYSNYNTVIAQGSLFYKNLVIAKEDLPDSAFIDIPEGYTVVIYPVDIYKTYANSMPPGSYVNIYYKSLNDNKEVMFGKFVSDVKILDVKDSSGKHVFENSEETRVPAYLLFAVPEETHLLIRKALYLKSYEVELVLVPSTAEIPKDEEYSVHVSSSQIEEFINSKTAFVEIDDLPDINEQIVLG